MFVVLCHLCYISCYKSSTSRRIYFIPNQPNTFIFVDFRQITDLPVFGDALEIPLGGDGGEQQQGCSYVGTPEGKRRRVLPMGSDSRGNAIGEGGMSKVEVEEHAHFGLVQQLKACHSFEIRATSDSTLLETSKRSDNK